MDNYLNSELGNIIVIRNFVFENHTIDHAHDFGRLCVILYIDGKYEYVVPITSRKVGSDNKYIEINNDLIDFYYKNNFILGDKRKNKYSSSKFKDRQLYGFINLKRIYKISSFYHDEVCKLKYDEYNNLMNRIKIIHHNNIENNSINSNIRIK